MAFPFSTRSISDYSQILIDNNAILAGKAVFLQHFKQDIITWHDQAASLGRASRIFMNHDLKMFVNSSNLCNTITAVTQMFAVHDEKLERLTVKVSTSIGGLSTLFESRVICMFRFMSEYRSLLPSIDVFVVASDTLLVDVVKNFNLLCYFDGKDYKFTRTYSDAEAGYKPKCDGYDRNELDCDNCFRVECNMLKLLQKKSEIVISGRLKQLDMKRTDIFGIDDANIYNSVFKADQTFDQLATLIQANDVRLDVQQMLDYFTERESFIPLILNQLKAPLNASLMVVLDMLKVSLDLGGKYKLDEFQEMIVKAQQKTNVDRFNLVPFKRRRDESAVHVIEVLFKIVHSAHMSADIVPKPLLFDLTDLQQKLNDFSITTMNEDHFCDVNEEVLDMLDIPLEFGEKDNLDEFQGMVLKAQQKTNEDRFNLVPFQRKRYESAVHVIEVLFELVHGAHMSADIVPNPLLFDLTDLQQKLNDFSRTTMNEQHLRDANEAVLDMLDIPLDFGEKDKLDEFQEMIVKAQQKTNEDRFNLVPFQRKRYESAVHVIEVLFELVNDAHKSKDARIAPQLLQFQLEEDLQKKLNLFSIAMKERHLHETNNTLVSAHHCLKNCIATDKTSNKSGSSSRFCNVCVPFLIATSETHARNQDMTHVCSEIMNLYHYILDDSICVDVFKKGHVFTHDVIYAHKNVDWYWSGNSGKKPTKVIIKWPANVPYYDWCHYKDTLGNVCILPPAMWRVLEEPRMTIGYLLYEVTIEPSLLFTTTVLTKAIAFSDPVRLTADMYVETPTPNLKRKRSDDSASFCFTLQAWVGNEFGNRHTNTITVPHGYNLSFYVYALCKHMKLSEPEFVVPLNILPNHNKYKSAKTGFFTLKNTPPDVMKEA